MAWAIAVALIHNVSQIIAVGIFAFAWACNFLVRDLATYSDGAGQSFSGSRNGAVVGPVATSKIAGSIGFILIRDPAWATYGPADPDARHAGTPGDATRRGAIAEFGT